MEFIGALSKSFGEWEEKTSGENLTSLDELVGAVLLQLGDDSFERSDYNGNSLKFLEDRLVEFENQGVLDEFLADSVIYFVNNYFINQISRREEYIKNNKWLLEKAKEVGLSEDQMEGAKKTIARLESKEYLTLAKSEKEIWTKVILRNFSEKNRKILEQREISKNVSGMNPKELKSFKGILENLN